MSWSELERLVEEAEKEAELRRALRHCRSCRELILAGQRLGFAIEARDLNLARELERSSSVERNQHQRCADARRAESDPAPLCRCG